MPRGGAVSADRDTAGPELETVTVRASRPVALPGLPVGVQAGEEEGTQNLGDEATKLLIGGEVKLGASILAAGFKALAARSVTRLAGPVFRDLADHAARHSTLSPNAYYNAAVRHLESGTRFTFRHDGQFKNAFITRTGPDSFTFTSASGNGGQIFTHIYDVSTQYLSNLGITLPEGF